MKTLTKVAIATFAMVGMAVAQPKDAAKDKPPVKAADPKDAKKMEPKAAPPAATPPAELETMGKQVSGTWKCKGKEFGMDGVGVDVTAVNTTKVDLDKWWIADTLAVKGKTPLKMQSFTTFDANAKKWRRVSVDNWGAQYVGTSDGMKDGKTMDWNLDVIGPMGAGMFRDHVDATDVAKTGVKMWGEMSMDKGKTFNKVYEMLCKK
jgi:hypothetical protein